MSRELILQRVRDALAPLPHRAPLPAWDLELLERKAKPTGADLAELFAARMRAVNGVVLTSLPELGTYLFERQLLQGYCDPGIWASLQPLVDPACRVETAFDRSRIDDYAFAITPAVAGIAETGTIVLSDKAGESRLAALAPWVHIAVVRRSTLLPDLATAIAALPPDPNVTWVTGPSKTADVEGILIEGVHGPGIQIALLL